MPWIFPVDKKIAVILANNLSRFGNQSFLSHISHTASLESAIIGYLRAPL
jgi:hypothetical protein